MWRLHGDRRRPGDVLVYHPDLGSSRTQGSNGREPRYAGRSGTAAACIHCGAGRAMRLLHRRDDHAGAGAAREEPNALGGRDPEAHGAEPLSLRHAYADPARGAARRRRDARIIVDHEAGRLVISGAGFEQLMSSPVSRRGFLTAGGALVVSFSLQPLTRLEAQQAPDAPKPPGSLDKAPLLDAWMRVDPDGSVTVFTGKVELGQGIKTALIQIAAEQIGIAPE